MSTLNTNEGKADPSSDTILVTGGSGFLGSHVVEALAADPRNKVVAISRNPSRYRVPGALYQTCDIASHSDIAALIEDVKPRIIIHTATPGPFAPSKAQYRDYLATKHLIEVAVRSPYVQAFIYTGSAGAAANASGLCTRGLTETETVLHSLKSGPTPYARTKGACDALVRNASTGDSDIDEKKDDFANRLRTAVIRVPAIYGPRDNLGTRQVFNVANTIVTRFQLGDNKPVHDFVYVESCANAHLLAAKALIGPRRNDDMKVDGEAFNVSDGTPIKFWDYARKLWTAAGDTKCTQQKVLIIPWWLVIAIAAATEWVWFIVTLGQIEPPFSRDHTRYMREGAWFDIEKARKRLGFTPLVETEEGIRRAVRWFLKQHKNKGP